MITGDDEDNVQEPNDDDLQEQAREVWSRVKVFYLGLALAAVVTLGLAGAVVYQSFGVMGVVVGGLALGIAIVLVCRWLLTF